MATRLVFCLLSSIVVSASSQNAPFQVNFHSKFNNELPINDTRYVITEQLKKETTFTCPDGFNPMNFKNHSKTYSYTCGNDQTIESLEQFIQIKKCCPPGFAIDEFSIGKCVPYSGRFPFEKYIEPKTSSYQVKFNSNSTHMSLQCPMDYNLYYPFTKYVDHKFEIHPPSTLYVPKGPYSVLKNITGEFCVDYIVNSNGKAIVTAATCLSEEMYYLRIFFRKISPYLSYQSATFLVICIVIYLSIEKLRNSMHGLSMICFMMCMVAVQLEYGTLNLTAFHPHTWCFVKPKTLGYFRMASSTWITVMGFDVFMKLIFSERLKKQQMIKRGICYFVYAWGLPMVFTVASKIYTNNLSAARINSTSQSRTGAAETCWFSNPVVYGLITYPNVVLVVFNLIFFIPSAFKLYASNKFLAKAENDLGKFETDRIKAIFRLFVIEEFYVAPRIIQFFADFSSPWFYVVTVLMYVLLGPLMFCLFILKKDVLQDVKKMFKCRQKIRMYRFWRTGMYSMESAKLPFKSSSSPTSSTSQEISGIENITFRSE